MTQKQSLSDVYAFAAENEGLAYALEHLVDDITELQNPRDRAALVCLASVLSARCRQLTEMIEGVEMTSVVEMCKCGDVSALVA